MILILSSRSQLGSKVFPRICCIFCKILYLVIVLFCKLASKFFYFQPHGVFNPKPVFAIIKFVDLASTVIVVVIPAIVPSSRLIITTPSERLLTPVLLNSDLVYCLLMTLLAVSNGYLTRFNTIMIKYDRTK